MTTMEFERRLRKLALREGMTFATFNALQQSDRDVLRATILSRFDVGAAYTEREVNIRLKGWLGGAGRMVATDHVTLRRLLVDTQVLERTSDCAEYRVPPDALVRLPAGLAAPDADAIVADTRASALALRQARKQAWFSQAGAASGAERA